MDINSAITAAAGRRQLNAIAKDAGLVISADLRRQLNVGGLRDYLRKHLIVSTTALPAETIVDCIDGLIESESISAGARLTAIGHMARVATARGLDAQAPIDGDTLDTLVVDAIPSALWMHA